MAKVLAYEAVAGLGFPKYFSRFDMSTIGARIGPEDSGIQADKSALNYCQLVLQMTLRRLKNTAKTGLEVGPG